MSENKYIGAWYKKIIYFKHNELNIYLIPNENKKQDNSPDYFVNIIDLSKKSCDSEGAWIKEKENLKYIYFKHNNTHFNVFINEQRNKDNSPHYNVLINEEVGN